MIPLFMPEFWLCLFKVMLVSILVIAPYMVAFCAILRITVAILERLAEWIASRPYRH